MVLTCCSYGCDVWVAGVFLFYAQKTLRVFQIMNHSGEVFLQGSLWPEI